MAQLSSRSAAIVQARDVGGFITPDGQWITVPAWSSSGSTASRSTPMLWDERPRRGSSPRSLHETPMALLEPAAAALDNAHGRGKAHRDIKTANFFVLGDPRGPDACVKVLDFGIAKVMAEHAGSMAALAMTGKEITSFTPNYGAPEQFSRSHGATGPWTDVFSMALILVEILRGGGPALDGADFMEMATASRDPYRRPTPRTLGLDVPEAVEQVFRTALAVAPGDRYPNMGLFWGALMHSMFPDAPTWQGSSSGGATAPRGHTNPIASPPSIIAGAVPPSGTARPPHACVPSAAPRRHRPHPRRGGHPHPGSVAALRPPPVAAAGDSSRGAVIGIIATLALGAGGFARLAHVRRRHCRPRGIGQRHGPADIDTAGTHGAGRLRLGHPLGDRGRAPHGVPRGDGARARRALLHGLGRGGVQALAARAQGHARQLLHRHQRGDGGSVQGLLRRRRVQAPAPGARVPQGRQRDRGAARQGRRRPTPSSATSAKRAASGTPINCVSWAFADGFCKVKKKRLPTEAEWEFAARGSDGRKYPWGDEPGDEKHMNACGLECNKWEVAHGLKPSPRMFERRRPASPSTAPVGSFTPRARHSSSAPTTSLGNVWEWTSTSWFETYKPDEAVNPQGAPAGDRKAIRGGGFNGGVALWLNPAFRYHQLATASVQAIGFRCAATL